MAHFVIISPKEQIFPDNTQSPADRSAKKEKKVSIVKAEHQDLETTVTALEMAVKNHFSRFPRTSFGWFRLCPSMPNCVYSLRGT